MKALHVVASVRPSGNSLGRGTAPVSTIVVTKNDSLFRNLFFTLKTSAPMSHLTSHYQNLHTESLHDPIAHLHPYHHRLYPSR